MKKNKTFSCKELFDSNISIGHSSAYNPPPKLAIDFQRYVDSQNDSGDLVIHTQDGYYRPYPFDEKDNSDFQDYITSEMDKANTIIERCIHMQERYQIISESILNKWREISNG